MNAEQAKANAAVMLAYAEGKTIECRSYTSGSEAKWYTTTNPNFTFSYYEYRIKAEPRTFYALGRDGENPIGLFSSAQEAERVALGCRPPLKVIELAEKL